MLQSFPITPCGAERTIDALSIAKVLYDVLGTVQCVVCLSALFAASNKRSSFKACAIRNPAEYCTDFLCYWKAVDSDLINSEG